jgi:hypothetical protein
LFGNAESRHHGRGHTLATTTCNRERIHQYRPDLLVQLFAQKLARPVQPCFNSFGLDAEKLGRFFDAHALDHTSYKNQPSGVARSIAEVSYGIT